MDLSNYQLEDLLLTALKSEHDSKQIYTTLANTTDNHLLKDKLIFLANEEEKHKQFIQSLYQKHYPNKNITLPKKTPLPLPNLTITEDTPLSTALKKAMNAEQQASDFYKSLATHYTQEKQTYNTLLYFADMEIGHFKLLEQEKESIERFEEADIYWPMVHVGP